MQAKTVGISYSRAGPSDSCGSTPSSSGARPPIAGTQRSGEGTRMAPEKGGRTGNYPAASTMRDGVLYGGAVAVDSANTAAGGWRAWTLVPSIIILPVVVLVLAQALVVTRLRGIRVLGMFTAHSFLLPSRRSAASRRSVPFWASGAPHR